MSRRFVLRSPHGQVVERDVVDGVWAAPQGSATDSIGGDLWALPGLVDAHAHIAAESVYEPGDVEAAVDRLRAALGAGATLVIDKGWDDDTGVRAARSLPETDRPIYEGAEQMVSVDGGYYPGFGLVIDPDELGPVATQMAAAGMGWVKLVGDWPRKGVGPLSNFTTDQLRTAVVAAEAAGARVAIHTMARETPSMAVMAGVHSIEHGLFLTEDDVVELGSRDGIWVPTVRRMEQVVAEIGPESTGGRLIREGLDNVARLLPIAVEAGVHVLTGTDLVGEPGEVAGEALRLAELGLTAPQALAAVSASGFVATGRRSDFAVGEEANAVFYPANPRAELRVLAEPRMVVRMGTIK